MSQDTYSFAVFFRCFLSGGFGDFSTGGFGAGGFEEDPTHIYPKQNAKHLTACRSLIWGLRKYRSLTEVL